MKYWSIYLGIDFNIILLILKVVEDDEALDNIIVNNSLSWI